MITGGIVVASSVYYGICATDGAISEKEVQLVNVSSELEGLHLQKGDFLSVYFVNGNEVSDVTLTLYIGDVNQEYNTSGSTGITVYNTGVTSVAPGAWKDGEVVNFSYTHNGSVVENADNGYYWEMVSKSIATSENYGNVLIDAEDLTSAASQNKVNELIDAKGTKELSYEDVSTGETTIGYLRLNTRYSEDEVSSQEPPIVIKVPNFPTDISYFNNDVGYIKNPIESSLLFNGTESNSKQIRVNTEGEDEGGNTIIDFCEDSTLNTVINSLGNIVLNPTENINIQLPESKQLNVLGGYGIVCSKLDILNGENNRLIVNKIKSHPDPNVITFESPVNIPNGPNTINGLQTDGITIGNDSLPTYIAKFLRTDPAKPPLNDWLADQLDGYLYTRRIHSQTGQISAGGTFMVELGGGAQHNYTINQQPGNTESEPTNANLNIEGYDIVGIIAWETWGSNFACTNICSVYWNNNDPSTGFLKLRVSSSQNIPRTYVSADILYKKKLRTTDTTGE